MSKQAFREKPIYGTSDFVLCLPKDENKKNEIKAALWNMINNHNSDFDIAKENLTNNK